MNKKLFAIGFIFFTILPIVIITQRHLTLEEGGYRYGFIGIILLLFIIYFTFIKKLQKRVDTWDIQDKNKDKVIIFRCMKPIILLGGLAFITYSISLNVDTILWTLIYVIASMMIGFVFEYASVILYSES